MKVYTSGTDDLLLRALNRRLTVTDLKGVFGGKGGNGFEGAMLSSSLRFVVDRWIDSGRNGKEESPWKRQPWRGLIRDYMARNPPELFFTRNGLSLLLGSPRATRTEERSLAWFSKCVEDMRSQLPDGRQPDAQYRKALHSGADHATALYLHLLESPVAVQLFRCDGCGTYFMHQRMPKKDTSIRRGSFCLKCKRKGKDRTRRTEDSRGKRTADMVKWAADAWEQWKPDRRHGERKVWVAEQLNKRLPTDRAPITKKWVTQHQDEIEVEMERRNHAKS